MAARGVEVAQSRTRGLNPPDLAIQLSQVVLAIAEPS